MFWKKKTSLPQAVPTVIITKKLKLLRVMPDIYFGQQNGRDIYECTIEYAESPRADYGKQGTKHTEHLKVQSWPELRSAIDALLDTSEAKKEEP